MPTMPGPLGSKRATSAPVQRRQQPSTAASRFAKRTGQTQTTAQFAKDVGLAAKDMLTPRFERSGEAQFFTVTDSARIKRDLAKGNTAAANRKIREIQSRKRGSFTKAAADVTPFVGTLRNWNQLTPAEKAAALLIDAVAVAPAVPATVRFVKRGGKVTLAASKNAPNIVKRRVADVAKELRTERGAASVGVVSGSDIAAAASKVLDETRKAVQANRSQALLKRVNEARRLAQEAAATKRTAQQSFGAAPTRAQQIRARAGIPQTASATGAAGTGARGGLVLPTPNVRIEQGAAEAAADDGVKIAPVVERAPKRKPPPPPRPRTKTKPPAVATPKGTTSQMPKKRDKETTTVDDDTSRQRSTGPTTRTSSKTGTSTQSATGTATKQDTATDTRTDTTGRSGTRQRSASGEFGRFRTPKGSFRLPSEQRIPKGQHPQRVTYLDGPFRHRIDLVGGKRTVTRSKTSGKPRETFQVTKFGKQKPKTAIYGQGPVDLVVTATGIFFRRDPRFTPRRTKSRMFKTRR